MPANRPTDADTPPQKPAKDARRNRSGGAAADREARLAEALRQNLRRRKAAAKKEEQD